MDLLEFLNLNITTLSYWVNFSTKFLYYKYVWILYFDSGRINRNLKIYSDKSITVIMISYIVLTLKIEAKDATIDI